MQCEAATLLFLLCEDEDLIWNDLIAAQGQWMLERFVPTVRHSGMSMYGRVCICNGDLTSRSGVWTLLNCQTAFAVDALKGLEAQLQADAPWLNQHIDVRQALTCGHISFHFFLVFASVKPVLTIFG